MYAVFWCLVIWFECKGGEGGGGAEEGRVRYGRGGVGDRIRGHKGGKEIKGNVWKGRGEG